MELGGVGWGEEVSLTKEIPHVRAMVGNGLSKFQGLKET